jgi:hypothetical protein
MNILLAIVHKLDAFNLKIEGKKSWETVTRTRLNVLMRIDRTQMTTEKPAGRPAGSGYYSILLAQCFYMAKDLVPSWPCYDISNPGSDMGA